MEEVNNNYQNVVDKKITHNQKDDDSSDIDIREILLILKRRKEIIIGIAFLVISIIAIYAFLKTPLYTASSVIQINFRTNNVIDFDSVVSGVNNDETAIQSEMEILNSRFIASRVIKKLNLTDDEEFNSRKVSKVKWLLNLVGFKSNDQSELLDEQTRERIELTNTIDNFLSRLNLSRKPKSQTVKINFVSQSPEKAALIANTITDEFLISQLATKFDATKRANDWLNEKISLLQKKLNQSELAVQTFKEENNLIETAGLTISDQQLSELNTQLILARTELAQARARLKSASSSINSSSEVLGSPLIQSLRKQESEVLRKKSDLTSRYGSRHPKIINVAAELRELRDNIEVEISKIKRGLRKEVEIAQARESSLRRSLQSTQKKVGSSTKAKVQLAELTREMNADRTLYESFLNRSKETSQNKDLEQSDARLIYAAEIPLKPSSPNKKLFLVMAFILGSGLGVAVAFLIEFLDNVVKDSKQLEDITGVASIGVIPALKKERSFVSYVLKNVTSGFSEALRSVLTSVHFSNPDNIPKSILITSSVPSEGKTTLSVTIATVAAESGKKVLLIDCDMKKPSVASKFESKDIKYCIEDYLVGSATEKQIINVDDRSGLHYISSTGKTTNSQNLLSSVKMKDFLSQMSGKYDLIIIDSPPVMAVSDALIAARLVDTVIFTVRWNKTPRQVVKAAIKQLRSKDIRLAGTVLTLVDLDKYSKYNYNEHGYYYKNYKEYYSA